MFGRTVVLKNELGVVWCKNNAKESTSPMAIFYAADHKQTAREVFLEYLTFRQRFFTESLNRTFALACNIGMGGLE